MARILKKGLRWTVKESNIRDVPSKPGVYVLYWYGKKCYVGKSKNMRERIRQHLRNSEIPFTQFSWYQTVPSARHTLESALIDRNLSELYNRIRGRR